MTDTPPRSLLLHAGTPKTGTKSLQTALHGSRDRLLTHRVLYPDVELSHDLKHQWMVNCLVAGDLEHFRRNVEAVIQAADETRAERVVLSTEGIFHHWSDFSDAARATLGELSSHFDVRVWTVFREPLSFAMSLYGQCLKNAPSHLTTCYGTSLPPEDIATDSWFARRLDYAGFVRGIETLFGEGCLTATPYAAGQTIGRARAVLGVGDDVLPDVPDRNVGLSSLGADLMRRLNRLNLEPARRERMLTAILDLDRLLAHPDERLLPSEEMAQKIAALSGESNQFMADRFGIRWRD